MKSSLIHFIVLLSVIVWSEQSKISALQWKVQQPDENPEASMTSVSFKVRFTLASFWFQVVTFEFLLNIFNLTGRDI